ncbi:unnamed protein product, partial [Symbiodinium pilosum]
APLDSLGRFRAKMGRSYRALVKMLRMPEVQMSGHAEWQHLSLIVDCLHVVAEVVRSKLSKGSFQALGTDPRILSAQILENHIAEKRTQKTAWFEQLGGSWHLRVDSEHPWGRYIYKFAYQAML